MTDRDLKPDLAELEMLASWAAAAEGDSWAIDGDADVVVAGDVVVADVPVAEHLARYIAAADPATIRWLVQRARDAERYERALAMLRDEHCEDSACVAFTSRVADGALTGDDPGHG